MSKTKVVRFRTTPDLRSAIEMLAKIEGTNVSRLLESLVVEKSKQLGIINSKG